MLSAGVEAEGFQVAWVDAAVFELDIFQVGFKSSLDPFFIRSTLSNFVECGSRFFGISDNRVPLSRLVDRDGRRRSINLLIRPKAPTDIILLE